jgi:hypothetical protein
MFYSEQTSSRKYIIFAPEQLLRKWREQPPNNCGDLHLSVKERLEETYYTRVDLLLI